MDFLFRSQRVRHLQWASRFPSKYAGEFNLVRQLFANSARELGPHTSISLASATNSLDEAQRNPGYGAWGDLCGSGGGQLCAFGIGPGIPLRFARAMGGSDMSGDI